MYYQIIETGNTVAWDHDYVKTSNDKHIDSEIYSLTVNSMEHYFSLWPKGEFQRWLECLTSTLELKSVYELRLI